MDPDEIVAYNRAAWDDQVGSCICTAIEETDPALMLFGLSGSELKKEAEQNSHINCLEVSQKPPRRGEQIVFDATTG